MTYSFIIRSVRTLFLNEWITAYRSWDFGFPRLQKAANHEAHCSVERQMLQYIESDSFIKMLFVCFGFIRSFVQAVLYQPQHNAPGSPIWILFCSISFSHSFMHSTQLIRWDSSSTHHRHPHHHKKRSERRRQAIMVTGSCAAAKIVCLGGRFWISVYMGISIGSRSPPRFGCATEVRRDLSIDTSLITDRLTHRNQPKQNQPSLLERY